MTQTNAEFRCGFVALIGRPNAGKSSLMNAIVGERLSAVTPLPQTTRRALKGIYSDEKVQIIFVDTPGIHRGDHSFNDAMIRTSDAALRDVDVAGYVVDLFRPFGEEEDFIAAKMARCSAPVMIIFNKIDACPDVEGRITEFKTRYPHFKTCPSIRVSALEPTVRETFLAAIAPLLPLSTPLFSTEDLTDEPMRFFAAEYLQKAIILNTREEVPHATFVEILDYKEQPEKHIIDAVIHVETQGQRAILIGKEGSIISRIRKMAEREMRRLAGCTINYRIHVKISPKWRDDKKFITSMGYQK
jgi:GTP-binding protein Era